ncbi:unnamed protein product [Cylicocyclus nassatus]|uniref:BPTI/Kunitz inhibitor domain-containing protein n=1 Tax=Cylicocyclus nassatus TaxID=53992 RepID=A0AA36M9U8_CYLNA|nr:unnamed protein product [Cylicocyclus nassatus]
MHVDLQHMCDSAMYSNNSYLANPTHKLVLRCRSWSYFKLKGLMVMKLLLLLSCIAIGYAEDKEAKDCDAPTHSPGLQCFAQYKRYTFNKAIGKCEEFEYGGCNPSANNFKTMEECIATCVKKY